MLFLSSCMLFYFIFFYLSILFNLFKSLFYFITFLPYQKFLFVYSCSIWVYFFISSQTKSNTSSTPLCTLSFIPPLSSYISKKYCCVIPNFFPRKKPFSPPLPASLYIIPFSTPLLSRSTPSFRQCVLNLLTHSVTKFRRHEIKGWFICVPLSVALSLPSLSSFQLPANYNITGVRKSNRRNLYAVYWLPRNNCSQCPKNINGDDHFDQRLASRINKPRGNSPGANDGREKE